MYLTWHSLATGMTMSRISSYVYLLFLRNSLPRSISTAESTVVEVDKGLVKS